MRHRFIIELESSNFQNLHVLIQSLLGWIGEKIGEKAFPSYNQWQRRSSRRCADPQRVFHHAAAA